MRIVVVMGRITTTMVFSSILFWQPTYTDLTVSSNGLMGFLMDRIVTTMVMGRITTMVFSSILFWQPTYTDLTVLSNGLTGFLMGRMVTTMVLYLYE